MAKLFGKKELETQQDAAVSSIPVPPADSALVIDLPEGQKLVLGKMEEGTVIEVATWRGTGRPDSRTNRLMLGVSFGGTNTPDAAKQEQNPTATLTGYNKYLYLVKNALSSILLKTRLFVVRLRPQLEKLKGSIPKKRSSQKKIENLGTSVSTETEEELDIDKWLESIRSNSRVKRLSELDETGENKSGKKTPRVPASSKTRKKAPSKAKKGRK